MRSWRDCDLSELVGVSTVAQELAAIIGPDRIMLVGARCRDLHHWRAGCDRLRLRSTNDIDVAIALPSWESFAAVGHRFTSIGSRASHRFLIAGIPTDVIPFGAVENPPGTTPEPAGKWDLNVHGFRDAYERAHVVTLHEGLSVRIPQVENYAALKAHAWLDRSPGFEYRDGPDLAVVVHWYSQDDDRLFDETNRWAMDKHDYEHLPAAAALLGVDIKRGLSAQECDVLSARMVGTDRDLLASHFAVGAPAWPHRASARRQLVDALIEQLLCR